MRRNRFSKALFATVAVLAMLVGGAAIAQEQSGAIEGVVTDKDGAALPGVTVETTGQMGAQVAVTDINGGYHFPALRSGVYKMTAKLDGFVTAEVPGIDLKLGTTQRVNFTLQPGTFEDTITVAADTVAIDVTKSSTATSLSREEITLLPRGRDFTDVVPLAAGAVNEQQAGGISIDGSTGSENRFIIDGIDTTDPQDGTSAVPMRADFIEEVQVKSAGYAAEYGGSTGGVINAITKSGGNEFHGAVLAQYEDISWNGSSRPVLELNLDDPLIAEYNTYDKDDETRIDPGFYVSGPILKDKLWFFGSYQPGIRSTDRTVSFTDGVRDTFNQDFQVDYAAANLTANFGSVLFKVGLNMSPYTTEGALPAVRGTGLSSQSSYSNGEEGERETYSASLDWVPSESFVVSGKVGFYHTNYWTTGVPTPPASGKAIYYSGANIGNPALFPEVPASLRHTVPWNSYGILTTSQKNIYERTAGALDASWFFSALGDHTLKFGFQTEEIYNDVIEGWNVEQQSYRWDRAYTDTSGNSHRGKYGYFRLRLFQTAGEVTTRNDAIFVQDAWAISKNLTVNVGVRAEHEKVPNYGLGPATAVEFNYDEKLAPRLGFAWDVAGDQKWKVFGSYGTYFDVMKYELPRGSFGGDKWVDYYYNFDNYDWPQNEASPTCTSGENTVAWTPTCPMGSFIEKVDRRHNSADPNESYIDPAMEPMEQWEAQIGMEHQLTSKVKLGARYIHKQLVRAIEDCGILVPGVGEVYYIANPGFGLTTSIAEVPFPKAEREYDGLELTFDRRFADNWLLRASYTYSELWGNYSGLASSDEHIGSGARQSPNVSRMFDVVQNSYDRNAELVYGPLGTDRPHQFKAQFLYRFPFNLSVGVNEYIASGIPASEEATVPIGTAFFPYGRNSLGRTPTLTQTDLALYQDVKLGSFNLQFGLNVMNIFDEDTETRRWHGRTTQDLPVSEEEFFAGGWDYEALIAELDAEGGLDPRFNQADVFQAPRAVRISVKFEF
jgi:hypothetical protein